MSQAQNREGDLLRFKMPSFAFDTGLSVTLSAVLHALLIFFSAAATEKWGEEAVQKVSFEPPPPILQKSFELAKRPEISEVQMEMLQTVSAQPEASTDAFSLAGNASTVGGELRAGTAQVGSGAKFDALAGSKASELNFEQVKMVELTESAMPQQEALSLKQELLNVGDLDIGRYQAIIIQDPENKKNIKGFFNMTVIDYDLANKNDDRFPTAVEELMRYMRDHTKINAKIEGTTMRLSDSNIMKAPFLYMTGNQAVIQLSDTEKKNLGDYLKNGGFLFSEEIRQSDATTGLEGKDAGVEGTPFDRQFKALLKDPLVLGSDGSKWQKIPKSHPLYTSFWDFDDGPPMGGAPGGNVFDLEMLELRGRVAVVFSDLNISWYWGDPLADARERGLQFGVNMIVFALTQPGGIANVTQFAQ
ncbi:MAG: DUF4159 domain-containing protein [Candidatus Latescibacteria bacterium]|nr:DUF4159 domain-containing protein [Candidatus Latescibacterota bacterium]